jgi:hypothetical protein
MGKENGHSEKQADNVKMDFKETVRMGRRWRCLNVCPLAGFGVAGAGRLRLLPENLAPDRLRKEPCLQTRAVRTFASHRHSPSRQQSCFVIERSRVQISARKPVITNRKLIERKISYFPLSLPAYSGQY